MNIFLRFITIALGVIVFMGIGQSQSTDPATPLPTEASETLAPAPQGTQEAPSPPIRREGLDPARVELGFWSILFTAVPLTLGIVVFLFLVSKHGSEGKEMFKPFFGEGQIAQLLVILLVIGNVCSLAIMGILQDQVVSALYGGVVGYVLGKKVSA